MKKANLNLWVKIVAAIGILIFILTPSSSAQADNQSFTTGIGEVSSFTDIPSRPVDTPFNEWAEGLAQELQNSGIASVPGPEEPETSAINPNAGTQNLQSANVQHKPVTLPVSAFPLGPELESVTMEKNFWNGLADFCERGYQSGRVNLEYRSYPGADGTDIVAEIKSMKADPGILRLSQDGQKEFYRLYNQRLFNFPLEEAVRGEVSVSDKKVDVIFTPTYKDKPELPDGQLAPAFFSPDLKVIILDTQALSQEVREAKRNGREEILSRELDPFSERISPHTLAEFFAKESLLHETIHLATEKQVATWETENYKPKFIETDTSAGFTRRAFQDIPKEKFYATFREILAALGGIAESPAPHVNMDHQLGNFKNPRDLYRKEHWYAANAVIQMLYDELGYLDYVAELEGYGPRGRGKEEVLDYYKKGSNFRMYYGEYTDFSPSNYKPQQRFFDSRNQFELRKSAKKLYHELLEDPFEGSLPSIDSIVIPEEVLKKFSNK